MFLIRSAWKPLDLPLGSRGLPFLLSLIRQKRDILIYPDNQTQAVTYFSKRGALVSSAKELETWKKSGTIRAVLLDLDCPSRQDNELAQWANGNGLKTVHISEGCIDQMNVTLTIDPSISFKQINGNTNRLQGPGFAILHHKYIHFHKIKKTYPARIRSVFLHMGHSLPYRFCRDLIDRLTRHNLVLKIEPGTSLKKANKKALKRIYPKIHFTGQLESLARPFFESDLAIVPAGKLAHEAAACGTPALYYCQNEAQSIAADVYQETGIGINIKSVEELDTVDLVQVINHLSRQRREEMGTNGKKLCDGKGAYRIIDFLVKEGIIGA